MGLKIVSVARDQVVVESTVWGGSAHPLEGGTGRYHTTRHVCPRDQQLSIKRPWLPNEKPYPARIMAPDATLAHSCKGFEEVAKAFRWH